MPLEDALNGVPGVDVIRSESVPQLSPITLLFKRGHQLPQGPPARPGAPQHGRADAPTWAAPPFMMPPVSATSRIMQIGLSSKSIGLMDLSVIAYWKIRARLLRVPGVANVAIWGERLKAGRHVQAEPAVKAKKVSLDKVMEVHRRLARRRPAAVTPTGAVIGTGGFVETPNQRISVARRHADPPPHELGRGARSHRRNGASCASATWRRSSTVRSR